MSLPIDQMLRDVAIVERSLVVAVADEVERLRECIRQIGKTAQYRSLPGYRLGQVRIMCDAVLAGADLRDIATVEAVAAGTWKPKGEGR